MTAADQAILSNPAADAPLEMRSASVAPTTGASPAFPGSASEASSLAVDKKDDDDPAKKDREDKPRSLAAVKVTDVRIGNLRRGPRVNELGLTECVGVCRS